MPASVPTLPEPGSLWRHTASARTVRVERIVYWEPDGTAAVLYAEPPGPTGRPDTSWVMPLNAFLGITEAGTPRFRPMTERKAPMASPAGVTWGDPRTPTTIVEVAGTLVAVPPWWGQNTTATEG